MGELPKHGDSISCGPLVIEVGYHNGDFRAISIKDHLGRRIVANASVPAYALQQIQEAQCSIPLDDPALRELVEAARRGGNFLGPSVVAAYKALTTSYPSLVSPETGAE